MTAETPSPVAEAAAAAAALHQDKWPLGPFLTVIGGLLAALLLSGVYTTYSITRNNHLVCPEIYAQAYGGPAHLDPYETAIRDAHRRAYKVRCG